MQNTVAITLPEQHNADVNFCQVPDDTRRPNGGRDAISRTNSWYFSGIYKTLEGSHNFFNARWQEDYWNCQ